MEIELARSYDLEEIKALEQLCFPNDDRSHEPAAEDEIEEGVAASRVLIVRGELTEQGANDALGFLQFDLVDDNQYYVFGIGVHPSHRNSGVANALLARLIEKIQTDSATAHWSCSMTIAPTNLAIQDIAFQNEFRCTEYIRNYYGQGKDRLYFRKDSHPPALVPTLTLIPVGSIDVVAEYLGRATHLISDLHSTVQGSVYELRERSDDQFELEAEETSASVSLTGTLLAALSFITAVGFSKFEPDLLAQLISGLVVLVIALLVYGAASAELARFRKGDFERFIVAGNAMSEVGGVYIFLDVLPVALLQTSHSKLASGAAMFAAVAGLLWYHLSGAAIITRHQFPFRLDGALIVLLTLSPAVGYILTIWIGQSAGWSIANLTLLGVVLCLMVTQPETPGIKSPYPAAALSRIRKLLARRWK